MNFEAPPSPSSPPQPIFASASSSSSATTSNSSTSSQRCHNEANSHQVFVKGESDIWSKLLENDQRSSTVVESRKAQGLRHFSLTPESDRFVESTRDNNNSSSSKEWIENVDDGGDYEGGCQFYKGMEEVGANARQGKSKLSGLHGADNWKAIAK